MFGDSFKQILGILCIFEQLLHTHTSLISPNIMIDLLNILVDPYSAWSGIDSFLGGTPTSIELPGALSKMRSDLKKQQSRRDK